MKVLKESKIPLYKGSKATGLVAVLFHLNFFTIFRVSNACTDEIFKLVIELFPNRNTLPKSYYKGRNFLQLLGLSYNSIHACRNGCCLFKGELAEALNCPECGQLQYTSHSSIRALKILQHFPLIPRLERIFCCARLAKLTKWHATRKDVQGNIECVPDSKAWKHIDAIYKCVFGSSY